MLTSKIDLAFFDWVQVGRGLSKELWGELHRQRNFFGELVKVKLLDHSDQEMFKVQTQTNAFNKQFCRLTTTTMRALHQRYTLYVSTTFLVWNLLNSSSADLPSAMTRTSSSRKERRSH